MRQQRLRVHGVRFAANRSTIVVAFWLGCRVLLPEIWLGSRTHRVYMFQITGILSLTQRAQAPVAERPVALPPVKQGERAVYIVRFREWPHGSVAMRSLAEFWPSVRVFVQSLPLRIRRSWLERARHKVWLNDMLPEPWVGPVALALQRSSGRNSGSYLADAS